MAMVEVEAIITTSQPVCAYGGLRLGDGVLEDMAS